MLAADPALRESLGAAGYLYAQAHLDSEAVSGKFESDLQELVGEGSHGLPRRCRSSQ